MIDTFVFHDFRGRLVLKSEGLVRLVELESNDQLSSLPSAAKRGIAKALVLAGGACEDQARLPFRNPLHENAFFGFCWEVQYGGSF